MNKTQRNQAFFSNESMKLNLVSDDESNHTVHETKSKGHAIRGLDYGIDLASRDDQEEEEPSQQKSSAQSYFNSSSRFTSNPATHAPHPVREREPMREPMREPSREPPAREDFSDHSSGRQRSNFIDMRETIPRETTEGSLPVRDLPGIELTGNSRPEDDSRMFAGMDDDEFSDGEGDEEPLSYEDKQSKKEDLLAKLKRLEDRGYGSSKRASMAMDLDEIEEIHKKLHDQSELDKSIKFQRKMLVGFVTITEYLNATYNPFDLQLEGWTESIYENLSEYDEVFEKLHEKYKDIVSVTPELELLGMLAGSAMMFHFSKLLFEKAGSKIPEFDKVMNSNPELKRMYKETAMNVAENEHQNPPPKSGGMAGLGSGPMGMLGNLMGSFTGNTDISKMANLFGGGSGDDAPKKVDPSPQVRRSSRLMPPPQQQSQQQQQQQDHDAGPTPEEMAAQAASMRTVKGRHTMKGPSDYDGLLESLTTGKSGTNLVEEEFDLSEIDNYSDLVEED